MKTVISNILSINNLYIDNVERILLPYIESKLNYEMSLSIYNLNVDSFLNKLTEVTNTLLSLIMSNHKSLMNNNNLAFFGSDYLDKKIFEYFVIDGVGKDFEIEELKKCIAEVFIEEVNIVIDVTDERREIEKTITDYLKHCFELYDFLKDLHRLYPMLKIFNKKAVFIPRFWYNNFETIGIISKGKFIKQDKKIKGDWLQIVILHEIPRTLKG